MDKRRFSNVIHGRSQNGIPMHTAVVTVLLWLLTLPGCVGSNSTQRGLDAVRIDTEIDDQARRALVLIKPMSAQSHIVVTTYNRAVLLSGQTPRPEWRRQAQQAVEQVPRVRRVFNELEVAPPASLPALSQDAFITSTIKARILRSDDVGFGDIKVITESSVVYLMGQANRRQADAAAEIARRVNGVKKVVLLFEET